MIIKGVTAEQAMEDSKRLTEHYRQCFRSASGTVVLDHLVRLSKESPFVRDDPHATSYNVGKQDVIKDILTTIESAETSIEHFGESV